MLDVNEFDVLKIGLTSPEQIRAWSSGEVKKPETINYRTLRPEKDGLFCEKIFGPTKDWECYCGKYKRVRFKGIICERCGVEVTKSKVRRDRMGHIELAAPVSHIWYFKGVPSRLGYLLDISPKDLEKVLYFASYLITDVDLDQKEEDYPTLKQEIEDEIIKVKIDAEERLKELETELETSVEAKKAKKEAAKQAKKAEKEAAKAEKEAVKDDKEAVKDDKEAAKDDKVKEEKGEETVAEEIAEVILEPRKPNEIESDIKEITQDSEELAEWLAHVFDAFQNLATKQLINDEQLYRDLKLRYNEYFQGGMGAEAIKELLETYDLEKEANDLIETINTSKGQKHSRAVKRLKVVSAFKKSDNKTEWMVLDVIPVIPPDLRPMVQLDGGRFATSDLNDLYRRVINRNNRLKRLLDLGAPEIIVNNEKRMLQEAVDALFDNGRRGRPVIGPGNRALKSLSDMLKGKQGRFRQNLLGKRVDYSGRSVIVVGPELKLYQCGLPKIMALELFKPFVMKRLVDLGHAPNIKNAKRMVDRMKGVVWDILEEVIKDHPVLLNRAPTLHRLGIQAFMPVLVEGKAIQVHPLVCTAFNADFDGDQMAVHLPLSVEAQSEARILMLSSNNILSPAHGRPLVTPTQDMILGSFYLTSERPDPLGEGSIFANEDEAIIAHDCGEAGLHAKIKVRLNNGERIETTIGRIIFNQAFPEGHEFINYEVNKKEMGKLIEGCCETYNNSELTELLDAVKYLGFHYASKAAITIGYLDIEIPPNKWEILDKPEIEVDKIKKQFRRGLITKEESHQKVVDIWTKATEDVSSAMEENFDKFNPVYMMANSGARGNIKQIRQLAAMRGLVANPKGDIIDRPIKANFREGLTVLEYFISTHGARKGLADTALRTADSGYLTRRLVDVSQDVIIREEDCGTDRGTELDLFKDEDELNDILIGRVLIKPIIDKKTKEVLFDIGHMLRRGDLDPTAKKAKIKGVSVRSVFTCEAKFGVCQQCYGMALAAGELVDIGEAVGIIAAQSIGEPGTQLTMRTFHTGGVAGEDITHGLPRIVELFEARKPKGEAQMAEISGKVNIEEDEKSREITITASKDKSVSYTISKRSRLKVLDGMKVKAGDPLTEGSLNPHEILSIKGSRALEEYLVQEVQEVYHSQGVDINDKHIEIIVRQMLRKVLILEAGDTEVLPGQLVDRKALDQENRVVSESGGEPATASEVLLGITKASLATDSLLSAASFQETTRVLTEAAVAGKSDPLLGLKENVIIGKLIPAATGMSRYRGIDVEYLVPEEESTKGDEPPESGFAETASSSGDSPVNM